MQIPDSMAITRWICHIVVAISVTETSPSGFSSETPHNELSYSHSTQPASRVAEQLLKCQQLEAHFFSRWNSRDFPGAKKCVDELADNLTLCFGSDHWRVKWAQCWGREIDLVADFPLERQRRFCQDLNAIVDIYSQCASVADHASLRTKLKQLLLDLPTEIDRSCPSYLTAVEAIAYVENLNANYEAAKQEYIKLSEMRVRILGVCAPGNLAHLKQVYRRSNCVPQEQ